MAEKFIFVKSNLPQRADEAHPLAIWEKDARHPKGEIMVSGEKVVKAYPTPAVVAKLREEVLVETDEPAEQTQDEKALNAGTEKTASSQEVESDLPQELPMRGRLIEQGITKYDDLKKLKANDLIALKYIDAKNAQAILDFVAKDAETK